MSESIKIPENFSFPYEKPYEIQLNFMKSLYKALELKKVGIFESPTGSGKSLSIICGSLTWLKSYKQDQKEQLEKIIEEEEEKKKKSSNQSTGFDWLLEHEANFDKNQELVELKEKLEKEVKQENSYKEIKSQAKEKIKRKRDIEERRILQAKSANNESNKDDRNNESNVKDESKDDLNDELDVILDDYSSDEDLDYKSEYESESNEKHVTKIYYCSRTHSQLSQFIGELKKTSFAEDTRLVTLGSRMNLCINDTVLKLGSLQMVNDRCLELQKTKKNTTKCGSKKSKLDTSKACPYYRPNSYADFNVKLMEEVFDIEDVVKAGHETKICPYYGSRFSIPSAELIALPYNILFQKDTRDSFSINLKDQIIIIDEAHNLIDMISQMYSIEISNTQITQASTQLNAYFDRYKSRLSAKNIMYCKQLINALNSLNKCFNIKSDEKNLSTENGKLSMKFSKMWTINEFFTETRFYNTNFVKLLRFCDETQIEKKLMGFQEKLDLKKANENNNSNNTPSKSGNKKNKIEKQQEQQSHEDEQRKQSSKCPLMQIKQFLKLLSTPTYEGRIFLNIDTNTKSTIKYILMNPNVCFEEIAKEARAVILAGGTMKPLSDFEQLIPNKNRIEYYTCGHVIPKENILPITLGTSLNGVKFDFSYNSRDNVQMLDELGNELAHLCTIVPAGVVVFFVSYDYLDKVMEHFKKSKNNIISKINEKKMLFCEPRLSQECEKVFNDYTKFIKKCTSNNNQQSKQTGAILFAVVGGKMSEGINFSDDLGRCVIVVGQPFPNIKSLELQEKMQFMNKNQPKSSNGKLAGQVYYENLCWKAINQSIGRAIRHQNDYATILLLDIRYCTQPLESLKDKLPKWICDSLRQERQDFTSKQIHDALIQFFKSKHPSLKNQ